MTDYNHNIGGSRSEGPVAAHVHGQMVKSKKMTKWYLKFFKRLLNSTVLNSFDVYRQMTGRNIQHLSYRILLLKGHFAKYVCAAETWSVPGRKASDNTGPRLTERHFLRKVAPKIEKSKPQRKCVVCSKHGKEKTSKQSTAAKYVMWVFAWKIASSCITLSSITEVMTIILLHLNNFNISLLKFFKNRIINLRIMFF
jgi:hypothetical protein